jgi:SAM-dependent methyltransferase
MQTKDFADLFELEETLWWFRGMRSITTAVLEEQLGSSERRRILDAGCGAGGNLKYLEKYANGGPVVGIDVSRPGLEFCRSGGARLLAEASATDLPFPSSSFDVVTSFDVLVQIPGEGSDDGAIAEMFRVLKPGGTAFVRAAAYSWMRAGHDAAMNTQRRYGLRELKGKISGAGFEIVRATYANSTLLPAAMLKRLVLERIGLADDGSDVRRFPTALAWLDPIFRIALLSEAAVLRRTPIGLPFGLSAVCVAKKPPAK